MSWFRLPEDPSSFLPFHPFAVGQRRRKSGYYGPREGVDLSSREGLLVGQLYGRCGETRLTQDVPLILAHSKNLAEMSLLKNRIRRNASRLRQFAFLMSHLFYSLFFTCTYFSFYIVMILHNFGKTIGSNSTLLRGHVIRSSFLSLLDLSARLFIPSISFPSEHIFLFDRRCRRLPSILFSDHTAHSGFRGRIFYVLTPRCTSLSSVIFFSRFARM